MTITRNRIQRLAEPTATLASRRELARKHSAMHSAQLSISRWTSGNSYIQMEIASALMPTSQVGWHAQAQRHFQEWLQQGGFASAALSSGAPDSDKVTAQLDSTQQGEPEKRVLVDYNDVGVEAGNGMRRSRR